MKQMEKAKTPKKMKQKPQRMVAFTLTKQWTLSEISQLLAIEGGSLSKGLGDASLSYNGIQKELLKLESELNSNRQKV